MPRRVKIEHFRNLVSLVAADGKIHDIERETLAKIAIGRGIANDRFNVMLERADEYKYIIPMNNVEREKQLLEMIEVAMVDGDFAGPEHELIIMVGEKLGFMRPEIEKMIETLKSNGNFGAP